MAASFVMHFAKSQPATQQSLATPTLLAVSRRHEEEKLYWDTADECTGNDPSSLLPCRAGPYAHTHSPY